MGRSAFLGRRTEHVRLRMEDCGLYYLEGGQRIKEGGWWMVVGGCIYKVLNA